jgi:PAS domain S-box-containing protein
VSYWNKAWLDYTGQTEQEAKGRAWDGIIHADDVPLVMEHYAPAFTSQQPYLIPAVRTKRYDGQYRWYSFKGNPRYSADGSFNGYIGVGFDIHEQKITEERLEFLVNERTKELQRSNADLQQFAHVASHDLKEPVRKVKTFTGRLEEHLKDKLDDQAHKFLDRIHVATDRMKVMIDGVLAYSTANANLQQNTMVDLNEVLRNIETDLEVALQKTEGSIHYGKLPTIEGAQVLLYQLFYNLINNSIKFSKSGVKPEITVSSEILQETDKRIAHILVKDNGIGFNQDQAERIFETFARLHPKDKFEGTGLGLALCKKIVERHGGTISARSMEMEGAAFMITLPLIQEKKEI